MPNYTIDSIKDIRKKVTHIHESISTAFHEAGHAIYGLLHFVKIETVYIFQDKKTKRICGVTNFYNPFYNIDNYHMLQKSAKIVACLNYAGLVAEKYHFKNISGSDKFPLFWKNGSSNDTLAAITLIKRYNLAPPGRKRYLFKKKLIKETYNELREHWNSVTLIAHELFKRKKLYYSDLERLLIKESDNKKFWKKQFKNIKNQEFIYNLT